MNRRDLFKGLCAAAVVAITPLKWIAPETHAKLNSRIVDLVARLVHEAHRALLHGLKHDLWEVPSNSKDSGISRLLE